MNKIPTTAQTVGFVIERPCSKYPNHDNPRFLKDLPFEAMVYWPASRAVEYPQYISCGNNPLFLLTKESSEKWFTKTGRKITPASYVVCACMGKVVE